MSKKKKILLTIVSVIFLLTLAPVVVFRFIPVETTSYMLIHKYQKEQDGKSPEFKHQYIPISEMPNHLIEAAITAEDATYLKNPGFSLPEIRYALQHNLSGKRPIRGGSTITQQTTRNMFLWPDRTWLRKGVEAYFTVLVNLVWDKKYLMEVYLNSIEMGDNIYGIEAAAQHYFNVPASQLTEEQSIKIVSIFPNPRNWSPTSPPDSIAKVQKFIQKKMQHLRNDGAFVELDWGHQDELLVTKNSLRKITRNLKNN